MTTLWRVLTRRKVLGNDPGSETPLARVLNTFDLTALGVGSTLGVGVYVLAGQVARNTAGPAVVLSFLVAAIASVFAGLCYAEFGARTPKAGSAYIYSYVCVGEFIAFVIGWNLILEYIIGSASVAKGLSSYVDNLCNGSLSSTFERLAPIDVPYLSPYFDVFAFSIPIILSIALAFGMKESSWLNNIFTTCNIGVVLFVIVGGAMNAHWSNWFIKPDEVKNVTNTTIIGHGGFFPFGIQGVIKGAATCFYGFVGFDCIATTGEEVKNPKKAIPIAIIVSLLIIFLAYFGTSTVLTLMLPYYEQDPDAPIPFAFQSVHWYTAARIVTFGALFGLYASLFGAMFPLPRILYAMASDGLIFRCLGRVSERFKTPVLGTLLAGIFTGTMAGIFALESLVNMMSIGTLLAYTIVAACVLLLRYSVDEEGYMPIPGSPDSQEDRYTEEHRHIEPINASEETALTDSTQENPSVLKQIFNFGKIQYPNQISQAIVSVDIFLFCILSFLLGLCALYLRHGIFDGEVLPLTAVTVILILMALTMLSVTSQPVSRTILSFQVPFVPLIPALSIFCNIYLMVMLDIATWIRFVVWMIIGVPTFYFTRRCSPKPIVNNKHSEGYSNNGFYGDNLVYSKGTDDIHSHSIIMEDKTISPLKIVENSNLVETPSPSTVIESLDFVIDSYVDDNATPCPTSACETHYSSVLSKNNGDYRDTPNTALRSVLLNSLNIDLNRSNFTSENSDVKYTPNENPKDSTNKDDAESKSELKEEEDNNDIVSEGVNEMKGYDSSSTSELSYESASSSIDTGQKETDFDIAGEASISLPIFPQLATPNTPSQLATPNTPSQLATPITPPPPPPPMIDLAHFVQKKIDSDPENSENLKRELKEDNRRKVENKELPMIINKNSLSSVKLRHVNRPSIEQKQQDNVEQSSDPILTNEFLSEPAVPKMQNESKTSDSSSLVNMRPVKKSGLNSDEDLNTDLDDSKNSKPGRYFKSKSVNELQMKNNSSKNENFSSTLGRMAISKNALSSVKLKPVARPTIPLKKEPEPELPDSVKFGTLEFEEFKGKLNEKLKKPAKILREPSFIDPKSLIKKPVMKINREGVNDDHIDVAKARTTMEKEVEIKLNRLKNSNEIKSFNEHFETENS